MVSTRRKNRWVLICCFRQGQRANSGPSRKTVAAFVEAHGAGLTVLEPGKHWFHTPEQMDFLDR